jgi:hypothetical protein
MLASNGGVDIIVQVITVIVAVTLVLSGRDPETGLPVKGLILAGEVVALTTPGSIAAALG